MTDTVSHMPPQDLDAEDAILGAMMMSTKAIEIANDHGLTHHHFYRPANKIVFSAIMALAERGAVDEMLVVGELKQRRQLTDAGGTTGVLSLSERVPAVSNARAYAKAVIEAATLRGLVEAGHEIARLGYERPDEPDALVSSAGMVIDGLSDSSRSGLADPGISTAADELMPFVEEMQERLDRGGRVAGLACGLSALDERWGGLQGGRLVVVAGRPGMGKSALASGIAESLVFGSGVDVYVVNLEMREQEQVGRLLARHGGVHLGRATNGLPTDADVEGAAAAALRLYEGAKRLHLDRASDLTVAQIRQRARRLHRRLKRDGGAGLGCIVVDYLQLITPPAGERNETAQLTIISRGLKSMALELGVPVIALSQLNRSVEDRVPPRPRLSDLRGSGSIEQDADVVLFLFRPDYYLKDETPLELVGKAEAITAKGRGVPIGTDELRWDGPRVRFSDWDGPQFNAGGRVA